VLVVGRRPFRDESAGERGESGGVGGAVRMVWFDPGLLENEEGMELTAEGRWEGEHRGGRWKCNEWVLDAPPPGQEHGQWDDAPSEQGTAGAGAWPCGFCSARTRTLFDVMGGPWRFERCELRGARLTVLSATHGAANVELERCTLGGVNAFDAQAAAVRTPGALRARLPCSW
jgi:hypothetical protein